MIVDIPDVLREKLGSDGARALVELLNEASVRARGDVIEIATSRFERRLAEELAKVRAEIGELRLEMGRFEVRIEGRLAAAETRLIRWMLAFWVAQAAFVVTLLVGFVGR